jgi:iron complex transport system substrate-binding protein
VRIVSLLPSATELVCALGAAAELVGRSAECDYPPTVQRLPVVMRARTPDSERSSSEIDQRVRTVRTRGESLYELDVPQLRALRPDVLLTQDLCGVCSVTGAEVERACAEAGVEPRIVSLSPRTLQEVWDSVESVGRAIDRAAEASRLSDGLRHRCTSRVGSPTFRAMVLEWLDPPILAGLWVPEMLAAAGAIPLGPATGEPGHRTTWSGLANLGADLVVVSPCSFRVERIVSELRQGTIAASLARVAPLARIHLADEAYFSRPGPRLADGVELVRALQRGEHGPFPMPVGRLDAVVGPVAA